MKATVIKMFRDRYTKKFNALGAEIDVTEERFAEINATKGGPYVETVPVIPDAPAEAEEGKTDEPKPAGGSAGGRKKLS